MKQLRTDVQYIRIVIRQNEEEIDKIKNEERKYRTTQ